MKSRKAQETTKARPEVIEAIEMLAKEKDISEEMLYSSIEEAVKTAYKKNLPKNSVEPTNLVAHLSREDGSIKVYTRMIVVEEVENPAVQITLQEARMIRPDAELNDIVEKDVTPKGFLRVAAMSAKQVLTQRIRDAERGKIYDEYVEKTDEILTAVVQRFEPRGAIVELGRTLGILENSEMIPGEQLQEGDHVKVYVLEVQRNQTSGMHSPQVRVSRIHPNLVKRLFEMEVPEIAGGIVTIKSLAREAGSRSKMAVYSSEPMIDPVGSCVGQAGARVDRVVSELRGEKIDIIKWSEDPAEFIANALNPAHVMSVYTAEEGKMCRVVVPDKQLSLAIGKEGQNARLAAKLTGWKIDIKSQSQAAAMTDMVDETGNPLSMPGDEYSMHTYELDQSDDFDYGVDDDDTL